MSNDDLIELVRRVIEVEGTEEEIDSCIATVSKAVPHPNWTDLIYYATEELSPSQVLERALAYEALQL